MSYRLSSDEPVADGLRRVTAERLDHAVAALRTGDDAATAIHDARKDVKKVRSLLRLARGGLGDAAVRREQDALRAAAALLSAARDADVLAATVDDLAERYAGQLPHAAFTAAHEAVAGGRALSAGDVRAVRDDAAAALAAVRDDAGDLRWNRCDRSTVDGGLARSYRRGRRALRDHDVVDGDVEALHAWRKRAKDLWYQQRLLEEDWPVVLRAQAAEAHRLTELLGDHHDLAVLRDSLDGEEHADVVELIDARSAELLTEALALGHHLYAERPKAFARRMARYG